MEFFGVLLALTPIAAAIWALVILYRLAEKIEDITERLNRIEGMMKRQRLESVNG